MNNNIKRILQLLDMARDTQSTARILAIADQVLDLDPDNPEALMIKADNIEDSDARFKLLFHALTSLQKPEISCIEDKDFLFLEINYRLSCMFFSMNKIDEALQFCEVSMKFAEEHDLEFESPEDSEVLKALYYRLLIEHEYWQRILAETMQDENHNLSWAYSRLIAAYMTAPENMKLYAKMFWDALMLGPDVPFYMLGYYEEPGDNDSEEAYNEFNFALMYYDVLSISDEFYNWFSRGVILFGLLSGRFEERERDFMIDALDALGGFEEYERMSRILAETDDDTVIETLAAHKCLSE